MSPPAKLPRLRLLLIGSALTLFACENPEQHKLIAARALNELHQHMARGEYAAIYAAADASLRERMTKDQLEVLFGSIHEKLGTAEHSDLRRYLAVLRINGFNIFVE